MMYLSKVNFRPSAQASLEIAKLSNNGAYSVHQLLWRLFPDTGTRNFLYREDILRGGRREFYVLSTIPPSPLENIITVQTKVFNPILTKGQHLAFKLRVNPTICITNKEGKSQRHDVLMHTKKSIYKHKKKGIELSFLMEQAAQQWLVNPKRLENWGIQLDVLPEVSCYTQHQSKKKGGHNIQFSSVDLEGLLTIKDSEVFLKSYVKGFGRAKALGCGLMLIRPV